MSGPDSALAACEVAVARPLLGTLAYRIPDDARDRVRPGVRVRVPLGPRQVIGVVDRLGLSAEREKTPRLRRLSAVLDEDPALDGALMELCRWVAEYYAAPLGLVLRAALPPGLMGGTAGRARAEPRPKTERVVRLISGLPTLAARDEAFPRAPRQREAFETLEALGGESSLAHMTAQLGFGRGVLSALVEKGIAELDDREVARDPFSGFEPPGGGTRAGGDGAEAGGDGAEAGGDGKGAGEAVLVPTAAQRRVIEALRERAGRAQPGVALLRGVTGSGKTLVYLELLESVLDAGRSAIVLIPEISLTPQTVGRFRARFGDLVAVLHSGLSDGERYDAWRALKSGEKRIAIGARSAVFAPVRRLGAIVIDEEHEGSYKQSDTPRYHARSVAIVRGRLERSLCLLGSATPSLESWANASEGRYAALELSERVTGHDLPRVELLDLREETGGGPGANGRPGAGADGTDGPSIFTARLRSAIAERLTRDEQVILLLNRRGYATFVQCAACGKVWSCASCSVSLTYHRRRGRLVCHHCGFEASAPARCDECGSPEPSFTGLGTEQVERRLGELFPAARVARMDLDTTATKWAHFEILDAFSRRQVDILLGTQMIAKGLDFPGVTLVGVVNADVGLNLPDFRASERTFQLLEQVAGRAGRGTDPGEVFVQTARPGHFALRAAQAHDYVGFAEQELEDRREPGYPPHRRLANVVVSGSREEGVAEAGEELAEWTRSLIRDRALDGIEVVGPAPCPIDRLRDRWRWHFLIKSSSPSTLGAVLRFLAHRKGRADQRLRVEIDRDPEALL